LTVPASDELGAKNSVALDFKHPLGSNALLSLWNRRVMHFVPHSSLIHVVELFLNGGLPFCTHLRIGMIVGFPKSSGLNKPLFEGLAHNQKIQPRDS